MLRPVGRPYYVPDRGEEPKAVWSVQSMRVTAFVSPDYRSTRGVYTTFTHEQPLQVTEKPAEHAIVEVGKLEDPRVAVTHTLERLQCDIRADANEPFGVLKQDPQSSMEELHRLCARWFASPERPRVLRLAFGAVVVSPQDTPTACNTFLSRALPNIKNLDPEHSTDLLYRINRPRPVEGDPTLRINRIGTWMAAQWDFASFGPNVGSVHARQYAATLEVDISTPADSEIATGNLADLFEKLQRAGQDLIENGDRA